MRTATALTQVRNDGGLVQGRNSGDDDLLRAVGYIPEAGDRTDRACWWMA